MSARLRTPRSLVERDQLVEQFLPLVRYVVSRLPITMPSMLGRDDLYSVGVIGLLHAANAFDPTRGASFKTFAYTTIRGAILDEIRRHDPVPRTRRDRLRQIERAAGALQSRLDRPPTVEELAEHLQLSVADLDQDLLALHTCKVLSLDDGPPSAESGVSLGSLLSGAGAAPAESAERNEQISLLSRSIGELPETERNVVVLYHYENLYLKEIGEILGVTESRVSQILTRAMTRLRLKMKELQES